MDASFWALVGLILFFVLIAWLGVPAKITAALDSRAVKIRADLEEARKLREEAQALLADYQRRRHEAEAEAEAIVAEARAEAEQLTLETTRSLEELIARRTKSAEDKIAQAEAHAIAEVKAKAADLAVAAAESILVAKVTGSVAEGLTAKSIEQVKAGLN
jgi:F-type H+-transporting ATPase subunit b